MPRRNRTSIPYKLKAKLQKEISSVCPFCPNEDVEHFQVHHIDNNPLNSVIENLLMICANCHSKITKGDITTAEVTTKKEMLVSQDYYRKLTETPLQASIDGTIILELEDIKVKYRNADWNERSAILKKLEKYIRLAGKEATYEILLFLDMISSIVRAGTPRSLTECICSLAMSFFPNSYQSNDKRYDYETGNICINIGYSIAYDSVIHLKKLSYIPDALTIWKHVYIFAKDTDNFLLRDQVIKMYEDIEQTLQRPERNDLYNALKLTRIFKDDLYEGSLAFPLYPNCILEIIKSEGGYQ